MEANIIVEAFNSSVDRHGLKYLQIIADRDSSAFSTITKETVYAPDVSKIECINHLIKNYGKALFKVKYDVNVPPAARKLLTVEKKLLKVDISNSIYHVFGDHLNRSDRYCNIVGYLNTKLKEGIDNSQLVHHLTYMLLPKAHEFIHYENNNKAETFMSILAKFYCGKRTNLIQRRYFELRAYLAALRYNTGLSWQSHSFQDITGEDIGDLLSQQIDSYSDRKSQRLGERKNLKRRRREVNGDQSYSPHASEAPLNITEYISEYNRILKTLQVSNTHK